MEIIVETSIMPKRFTDAAYGGSKWTGFDLRVQPEVGEVWL